VYTCGEIKFLNDKESLKAKGWSSKGIECFNLLFQWVKYDREKHPNFVKKLIKVHAKDPKI
jgi:hypothetical protein